MERASSIAGACLVVKGGSYNLLHKAPLQKRTIESYAPSIGWAHGQISALVDALIKISENFTKIAGIPLSFTIVIDKFRENELEWDIKQNNIAVMLSCKLNPEETIEQLVLEIGNELTNYCITHCITGVPSSSFYQIEPEALEQMVEQVINRTIFSKVLFSLLPNDPPFIPTECCRRESKKLMTSLMEKVSPLCVKINQAELLDFLAYLAVLSVIEEKNGSNQIHQEITARFAGNLGRELKILGLAFNGADASSEEFQNLYEQFRQISQVTYDAMEIKPKP
ncbi:MAG: hypothetical protein WCT39_02270 [Candidatus Margulisiibacteriota bacterium]